MSLGGLGRGRTRRKLNAEVNIINLVDVVLVLLIIFMITAPMMQGAIPVELPRAVAAPPNNNDAVVVTVFRDGKVKVGEGSTSTVENAIATLTRLRATTPQLSVNIMGDTRATFGEIVGVLDALRVAGFSNASLITKPVN